MTKDDILQLIASGAEKALVNQVSDLSEEERAALKTAVVKLHRTIIKDTNANAIRDVFQREEFSHLARFLPASDGELGWVPSVSYLAVIAVGGLKEVKGISLDEFRVDAQGECALFDVLENRRPDWADAWLEHQLSRSSEARWSVLEPLIQRGVFKRPTSDAYYRLLANCTIGCFDDSSPQGQSGPVSGFIRDNPELLDGVWRLFELEDTAFLARKDEWAARREVESWALALKRLSDDGLLDRQRLFIETMTALGVDLGRSGLLGLMDFYQEMAPSLEEKATLQAEYHALLAAPSASVIKFALEELHCLCRDGSMNTDTYLDSIFVVFERDVSGLGKKALSTLKMMVKAHPDQLPRVLDVVIQYGLAHVKKDVVEASLKALKSWRKHLTPAMGRDIEGRMETIPSTLRSLAEELCGQDAPSAPPAGDSEVSVDPWSVPPALGERMAVLPEAWLRVVSVDSCVESLRQGQWPVPLDFTPSLIPVLSDVAPIKPVSSVADTVDAVVRMLESGDHTMAVEPILDGIARFGALSEKDRAQYQMALRKRVTDTLNPSQILNLTTDWLDGRHGHKVPDEEWDRVKKPIDGQSRIDKNRVLVVRQRLQQGIQAPLLSTPTHTGGWLDPETLVCRWKELETKGVAFALSDVVQALLRLAPDWRGQARAAAATLTHPWAKALRFALGEDVAPDQVIEDPGLWLAAACARYPDRCCYDTAGLGLPTKYMDAASCAIQWCSLKGDPSAGTTLGTILERFEDPGVYDWLLAAPSEFQMMMAEIGAESRAREEGIAMTKDVIGAELKAIQEREYCLNVPCENWSISIEEGAMLRPGNDETTLAAGIRFAKAHLTDQPKLDGDYHVCFRSLADPYRPWSALSRLAALIGLCSPDPDVRAVSVDGITTAISDGRLSPATTESSLAGYLLPSWVGEENTWIKPKRVAEGLGEVARVSPLHGAVVAVSIEGLLLRIAPMPPQVNALLALLLELRTELGEAPAPDFSAFLQGLEGKKKTAQLARKILAIKTSTEGSLGEAKVATLEARIARAERWAGHGS